MEGINSRLDGLQAAILNVKLPYLQSWTDARQRIAERYTMLLGSISEILPPQVAAHRDHVYHLYVIRTNRRDELKRYLEARGVATGLNYPKALPFYPAYQHLGHTPDDFPVAHANQSRILSLPLYPELSWEAVDYVIEQITGFFEVTSSPVLQAEEQAVPA